jgi:hypothetical protein
MAVRIDGMRVAPPVRNTVETVRRETGQSQHVRDSGPDAL